MPILGTDLSITDLLPTSYKGIPLGKLLVQGIDDRERTRLEGTFQALGIPKRLEQITEQDIDRLNPVQQLELFRFNLLPIRTEIANKISENFEKLKSFVAFAGRVPPGGDPDFYLGPEGSEVRNLYEQGKNFFEEVITPPEISKKPPISAPPPPPTTPSIFGDIETKGLTEAQIKAPVAALLPAQEALALSKTAEQEEAGLESARQRQLEEQKRELELLQQRALQEQGELEAGRQRFLEEEQRAFPEVVEQARQVFRPGIERQIQRTAEVFGSRGLGTGGFQGSGAIQELARRGAQELEETASQQALQNLMSARQQFGQLGLEAARLPSVFRRTGTERQLGAEELFRSLGLSAAQVPSVFRRAGLERGFELKDIPAEREFQKQLAALGAQAQVGAAKEKKKGDIFGGLISLVPYIGPAYNAVKGLSKGSSSSSSDSGYWV